MHPTVEVPLEDRLRSVLVSLSSLRLDPGTEVTVLPEEDRSAPVEHADQLQQVELRLTAPDDRPGIRIEVDLADAIGYWHPGVRDTRLLPPDWVPPRVTSLVDSVPLGVLYDAAGRVLLGWAAQQASAEMSVCAGVSEEHKSFAVEVRPVRPVPGGFSLVLTGARDSLAVAAQELTAWVSAGCPGTVLQPAPVASRPVYSTWYTFTQDIDADHVLAEARIATGLGCGSVFVDDGWQQFAHGRGYQGCGDWLPDGTKFADLAGTVAELRDLGLATALWIAPLLLGAESRVHADLAAYAPQWVASLNCYVLDPRHGAVRRHLAGVCRRLVSDYGAELLKIDFLEQAMVYQDIPVAEVDSDPDVITDLGAAVEALLGEVRTEVAAAGRGEVTFEFRQPYVSPAIARYGQILRAGDCPADSVVNRISTLDARLIAAGRVVHADPMMWGTAGGAEAVAQQLYGGWFAVPQISMPLTTLPPAQTDALRSLLGLWQDHAPVTLGGELEVEGPEQGYTLARAVHPDLDRAVLVSYARSLVELDAAPVGRVTVINATGRHGVAVHSSRDLTTGQIRTASATEDAALAAQPAGLTILDVPPFGSVDLVLA